MNDYATMSAEGTVKRMLTDEDMQALLDEKEINDLIDDAADTFRTPEDILREQGLTLEQAVREADAFRERFLSLLQAKLIPTDNISRICRDVADLTERERSGETVFLYTALLTENGLLFVNITDDEQKALLWLEHKERVDFLTQRILNEPVYLREFNAVRSYKPLSCCTETDLHEQAILYEMAIQNTFLYKGKNNVFLQNIGELVRLVNANELYRRIKPYVYFAVLSRRHSLMTTRENYSPNIPKMFEYQEYTIQRDNKKNFDTYQSYLELYAQLRESYEGEIDGALTDYCMVSTSNLCEWFYENCEPEDVIPMSLPMVADYLSNTIWLPDSSECSKDFIEVNPVFEIACENILSDADEWKDYVSAMQNGENIFPYAERLYRRAVQSVPCPDKEGALQYAQFLLCGYMEEYNRQLLVNASKNFIVEQ